MLKYFKKLHFKIKFEAFKSVQEIKQIVQIH